MLALGHLSWGKTMRPCRLTRDEQATHFCFWALNAAPLLLGCDVQKLDAFALSLLLNDELIAINQDALALQARRIRADLGLHVYAKPLANGDLAVGLFNTRATTQAIRITSPELGLEEGYAIRDCLLRADLGVLSDPIELPVRPHGCRILRLIKPVVA
jgi:alpha-galactosidase